MNCNIGIDLGGTKIEIALVSDDGKVLQSVRCKTDVTRGFSAIVQEITHRINEIKQSHSNILSVGIGIAGQIDPLSGAVIFAPNLGWKNVPLQQQLAECVDLPVIVANDVRAATLGEWIFGAGKECSNLACVFVGTGIGGGIVCAGNLIKGFTNTAGEIGHITIDPNGPPCTCGNRGCWEAFAGGWAIGKKGREAVKENPTLGKTLLTLANNNIEEITAHTISQAYALNDPLAKHILSDVENALIIGAANLVNILNPKKLIFGGGIIEGNPFLISNIQKGIEKHALKAASSGVEVVKALLGNQAGVIGAASLNRANS